MSLSSYFEVDSNRASGTFVNFDSSKKKLTLTQEKVEASKRNTLKIEELSLNEENVHSFSEFSSEKTKFSSVKSKLGGSRSVPNFGTLSKGKASKLKPMHEVIGSKEELVKDFFFHLDKLIGEEVETYATKHSSWEKKEKDIVMQTDKKEVLVKKAVDQMLAALSRKVSLQDLNRADLLSQINSLLFEEATLKEVKKYFSGHENEEIKIWIKEALGGEEILQFIHNPSVLIDDKCLEFLKDKAALTENKITETFKTEFPPKESLEIGSWKDLTQQVDDFLFFSSLPERIEKAILCVQQVLEKNQQPPTSFTKDLCLILKAFKSVQSSAQALEDLPKIENKKIKGLVSIVLGGQDFLKRINKKPDVYATAILDKCAKIISLNTLAIQFDAYLSDFIQKQFELQLDTIQFSDSHKYKEWLQNSENISRVIEACGASEQLLTFLKEHFKKFFNLFEPLENKSKLLQSLVSILHLLLQAKNLPTIATVFEKTKDSLLRGYFKQILGPVYDKLLKYEKIIKEEVRNYVMTLPKETEGEIYRIFIDNINHLNKNTPSLCELDNAISDEIWGSTKSQSDKLNVETLRINSTPLIIQGITNRFVFIKKIFDQYLDKNPLSKGFLWTSVLQKKFTSIYMGSNSDIINFPNDVFLLKIKELIKKIIDENVLGLLEKNQIDNYVQSVIKRCLTLKQTVQTIPELYSIKWLESKKPDLSFMTAPALDIVNGICPSTSGHLFTSFRVESHLPKNSTPPYCIPSGLSQEETFAELIQALEERGWNFTSRTEKETYQSIASKIVNCIETPFTSFLKGMTIQAMKGAVMKKADTHYHEELYQWNPYTTKISKKWQEAGVSCKIEVHPNCAKIVKVFEENIYFYETRFLTPNEIKRFDYQSANKELKENQIEFSSQSQGYLVASVEKEFTLIWQKSSPWKGEIKINSVVFKPGAPLRSIEAITSSLKRFC